MAQLTIQYTAVSQNTYAKYGGVHLATLHGMCTCAYNICNEEYTPKHMWLYHACLSESAEGCERFWKIMYESAQYGCHPAWTYSHIEYVTMNTNTLRAHPHACICEVLMHTRTSDLFIAEGVSMYTHITC